MRRPAVEPSLLVAGSVFCPHGLLQIVCLWLGAGRRWQQALAFNARLQLAGVE